MDPNRNDLGATLARLMALATRLEGGGRVQIDIEDGKVRDLQFSTMSSPRRRAAILSSLVMLKTYGGSRLSLENSRIVEF